VIVLDNQFEKYFIKKDTEWHSYKIGEYHVSAVGCSHQDLEPEEHYGPCLRSTYWDYLDPVEKELSGKGNLRMGNILHGIVQDIYKESYPACSIEFPILLTFSDEISGEDLKIRGSVDILDFNGEDPFVLDLKTSSMFTFPSSPYDLNPTYKTQVILYTYMLRNFILKKEYFDPKKVMVVFIKKHNAETVELEIKYNDEMYSGYYYDFIARMTYLHECLIKKKVPVAEPHRWCKLCPYLEYCMEKGDIIEVKEGRKKRYLKNG